MITHPDITPVVGPYIKIHSLSRRLKATGKSYSLWAHHMITSSDPEIEDWNDKVKPRNYNKQLSFERSRK